MHIVHCIRGAYHVSISPGRDKPVFTSPVDEVCFSKSEEDNEYARQTKATDLAFFLRRQDPEINLRGLQSVLMSSEEREHTAVGYLPIILAPAHEFDTLNTVVKRCMALVRNIQSSQSTKRCTTDLWS